MRSYNTTEHAQKRKQQRGISDLKIELIQAFGDDHYQKGGCSLSYISEKKLNQLRQAIDMLTKVAIVKDASERVVTVMHKEKRISTTKYAA